MPPGHLGYVSMRAGRTSRTPLDFLTREAPLPCDDYRHVKSKSNPEHETLVMVEHKGSDLGHRSQLTGIAPHPGFEPGMPDLEDLTVLPHVRQNSGRANYDAPV